MASVQAFISVMDEFLSELKEQFPKEKKIGVYYNTFLTMKKVNSRKILETFMAGIQKHGDKIVKIEGSGGLSPMSASKEYRMQEAEYATGWYQNQMADIFR